MEAVGYLIDAEWRGAQQIGRFHQQVLIDVIDDSATSDLPDDTGEIDSRDVEGRGIEGDVVVFRKMLREQADETEKDLLYSLGHLTLAEGFLLCALNVEQEDGIEHLQYLSLVDVVGVQVADDLAHLFGQPLCIFVRQ